MTSINFDIKCPLFATTLKKLVYITHFNDFFWGANQTNNNLSIIQVNQFLVHLVCRWTFLLVHDWLRWLKATKGAAPNRCLQVGVFLKGEGASKCDKCVCRQYVQYVFYYKYIYIFNIRFIASMYISILCSTKTSYAYYAYAIYNSQYNHYASVTAYKINYI